MHGLTLRRKIGIMGAAGVLALAGAGAVISHNAAHAAGSPGDKANVQVQSGDQTTPDTADTDQNESDNGPEATSPDPAGPDVQSGTDSADSSSD